jgi:hypothetical protein
VPAALARVPVEALATGDPRVAGSAPGAREAYLSAFTSALNELFIVGAVVAFAGALLAALLIRQADFVRPGASGAPHPAAADAG